MQVFDRPSQSIDLNPIRDIPHPPSFQIFMRKT